MSVVVAVTKVDLQAPGYKLHGRQTHTQSTKKKKKLKRLFKSLPNESNNSLSQYVNNENTSYIFMYVKFTIIFIMKQWRENLNRSQY